MTDPTAENRVWTKRLIFAAGCLGLLACLVAPTILSILRNQIPPYVRPKTPQPNAYVYYIKAADAIVDGDRASEAVYGVNKADYSLTKKEALLGKNVNTLKLMRQGLSYQCLHPLAKSYDDVGFGIYSKFRELARLKKLEGDVLTEKKQWARAAASYLDNVHFGKDLARGGPLIAFLVGKALTSMGRSPLWPLIAHLNATEATSAARRLELIAKDRVSFSEILQVELYQNRLMQQDLVQKANLREQVGYWQFWLFNQYQEQSADYWMTKAPVPYAVQKRKLNETFLYHMDKLLPDYNQILRLDEQCACSWTNDPTQDWLQATALALHAYRLEHGEYPIRLTGLVPTYLSEAPPDPFFPPKKLHYRKLPGRKYLLYSVGPDGKDDGGKPISNSKGKNDRQKHYVLDDSKGDIVTGVNIY